MSPLTELITGAKAYGWSAALASGTFESIASASPTGSGNGTNTVTFSSIPSTYDHLQIRITALVDGSFIYGWINNDTGSNYTWHQIRGTGTTTSIRNLANQSELYFMGDMQASTYSPSLGIIDIFDYSNTSKIKTSRSLYGSENNSTVGFQNIALSTSLWRSTSIINSITIVTSGTYYTGTKIALYGIKGA